MSDALLPYYNRELDALRRLAAEFAVAHPKIAGRLRLSPDSVDDPHVARLLEGVAFLAARVHHRLDDEFPELTDTLLEVLYPHYLAPFPSCFVARLAPQQGLQNGAQVPAGLVVDTEPVRGERCRYRSAYPVTVWPVEIESARLSGLPILAPANPLATGAVACLRLVLKGIAPDVTFTKLGMERLRLFLRGANAPALHELISAHAISVGYADNAGDTRPVILGREAIEPVGFAPEEALLPWPARAFAGFRLLSEYFAFPEKFLFLDLCRMEAKTLVGAGNRIEVFIWLDRAVPELERTVDADSFALGCTPLVNLFPQRCEPIRLDDTAIEYRVVPDSRRPMATEVWSVTRVREPLQDGGTRPWRPFHRLTHADPEPGTPGGSYATVRHAGTPPDGGTEVFLAPHDPDLAPRRARDAVLSVDALCLNRDLPTELPFGGGRPALKLVEGVTAIGALHAMTAPTPTLRRTLRERTAWRLVSQLSLGQLSVVGGAEGAAALREVLRLHDLRDSAETRAAIASLLGVTSAPGAARLPGGPRGLGGSFVRGLDVTLTFDQRGWQTGGLFVLASVLDRFLALHATVNSFVRTRAVLRGASGNAAAWPARAGWRVLL
ncbi:type VI secretion system baseplate subunit TssF [Roseomonas sp. AR75]|uniref:type VI secretion system baseplate subunit TssF n=1 Tax=Roseomonas sp. AR75 TaxID=2562311 RepID=UPI0010C01FF2|nr:type VI secretion system baseplate subunit TssF [Roseomonas sp. AR75]